MEGNEWILVTVKLGFIGDELLFKLKIDDLIVDKLDSFLRVFGYRRLYNFRILI